MSIITQVRGGRDRTHPITAGLSRAISALLVTQTRISSAWWIRFAVLFLSGPGLLDVPAFSLFLLFHIIFRFLIIPFS